MKDKTDAELVAEAEKLNAEYWYHDDDERRHIDLANELASRLKSANERNDRMNERALGLVGQAASLSMQLTLANELGEKILGNIKGLLCERDEGSPSERNLELAGLIAEWDKRSDDGVRND